jgi:hypothetical protein
MSGALRFTRSAVVLRLRRRLERDGWPRLQMMLIVALTGAAGLLCSALLRGAGVEHMAVRYPLALGGAYAVFLGLLWLWMRTRAEDYFDALGVPDGLPWPARTEAAAPDNAIPPMHSGGGGEFAGGGASASFAEDAGGGFGNVDSGGNFAEPGAVSTVNDGDGPLDAVGEAASAVGDADELAIPLAALALVLGVAFASLYVVWAAPVLFAELLVDGVLSCSLYRRLRTVERRHWLKSALRRTLLPFCITAAVVAGVGAALAAHAPGATTLGEALRATAASD